VAIKRYIIWGLRRRYHTHRYIHAGFFSTLKKLGKPVLWLEDSPENASRIQPGDLIITAEPRGRLVAAKTSLADYHLPIRDDVYYCLHNYQQMFIEKIRRDRLVILQVYTNGVENGAEKWGSVTYFDPKLQTLYQPWGTNLLATEFSKPTFNTHKIVFWIGSIWNNDKNQGNTAAIGELKQSLAAHGIRFKPMRFIPEWLNKALVRYSRLAPAIAGKFQADVNYLPCRMFKNISYGQLGFSNVQKFREIFGAATLPGTTIDEMVSNALALPKDAYLELVRVQQEIVKQYTYVQTLANIEKAFEKVSDINANK
jgi:hypothetical protein